MKTYVIQNGDPSFVKIGKAQDTAARLRDLQTGSPTPLRILAEFDGDRERELHIRFARHRVGGEWFAFDPEIQAFLLTEAPTRVSALAIFKKYLGSSPLFPVEELVHALSEWTKTPQARRIAEELEDKDLKELRTIVLLSQAMIEALTEATDRFLGT